MGGYIAATRKFLERKLRQLVNETRDCVERGRGFRLGKAALGAHFTAVILSSWRNLLLFIISTLPLQ